MAVVDENMFEVPKAPTDIDEDELEFFAPTKNEFPLLLQASKSSSVVTAE